MHTFNSLNILPESNSLMPTTAFSKIKTCDAIMTGNTKMRCISEKFELQKVLSGLYLLSDISERHIIRNQSL